MTGPTKAQLDGLAKNMGVADKSIAEASELLGNLYKMFIGVDATLVEINPLAETPEGGGMVGKWWYFVIVMM